MNKTTLRFACPACGKSTLEITRGPHRDGGSTVLVHCWGCGGGLDDVSAASEIPRYKLLKWPPPQKLGEPVTPNGGAVVPRLRVSQGTVGGCVSALWAQEHEHALAYLTGPRGLTDETIRRWELGYDIPGNAITIPVRDESNALLGIKRRFLSVDAEPKAVNSRGLAALYPLAVFEEDPAAVVLCEGEFDALLLNQHGIPAVTPTTGTQGWDKHPEWSAWFIGRHVAVLYDAGSYALAAERAVCLRREGARRAWPVDLPLTKGEDVTDWFLAGQTAAELRDLINNARHRRAAA